MAASSKDTDKRPYFQRLFAVTLDPTLLVYVSGFLDLFGVSMILPLLLSHSRDLGSSPTVTGILGSTYGALQLFSSPIIGQWSDVAGRRFTLLVCLFISALGYSMLAMATTVTIMFIARIPLGLFKQSQTISKSYLSDITSGVEYSKVLGRFNSASNIGFILGPTVAGHIAERPGGFYIVAILAALLFFLNFGLIWLFIPKASPLQIKPESTTGTSLSSNTSRQKTKSDEMIYSPKLFLATFSKIDWSDIWDLFLIKFFLGVSIMVFRSNFSLMLIEKFDTSPRINGYIISFNSTISAFVGFSAGYVAKFYNNNAKLLFHLSCFLTVTLFSLAISPSLVLFVTFLIPFGFVTPIVRISGTSLTIERTKGHDIGTLMGFQQSCMSVARMLAPLLAGLVQEITPSGPGLLGTTTTLMAVTIFVLRPQDVEMREKKRK